MTEIEQLPRLTDGNLPRMFEEDTTDSKISVLVVDDDPELRDLTATFLERERDEFDTLTAPSASDGIEALETTDVDAIVSDYDMPKEGGLEFLAEVREDHADIPFILFTGKGSEEIASEAISKGVTDYLQKKAGPSQYSILANRLVNAVQQHRASKALRRSQEKFSKLVTNSSDVIAIVNESGHFEYVSPASESVLGYEQEELIGTSAFDYMPPDDRQSAMEEFFACIENPDREPTIEFRFERPGDGWTVIEARGKNLFDDDFIDGFVVNGRDITALKRREQELEQQNEQLKDMRQAITHDLRNPLSVAADSLALYHETGEVEYLEKGQRALERMDSLLDQIVTLASHEAEIEETEQVDLKRIVRAAWEMVDADGATLHVDNSKELEADPGRLQQVFENLLRNAVDHSPNGVTVRVGTTDSRIYVEDDGPGIPEEERESVFKSGYTTSQDNTGFGLNIVKQIVLGHGWDVDITDGKEGGARFEITGVTFQPTVYS